jgi:hypothetical protein
MAVNLFALAQQPERATYKSLADTADEAARHAEALDSLIDNQADDLAGLLVPVRDFLRMSQRLRADGEWWTETSEDAPMPDAEEQIRAAERAAAVHEAIRGLPDIFRDVFVRCEVDGADMPEVAREIGIPVNTGYNRLRLARAQFRKAVKRIMARRRLASGDL